MAKKIDRALEDLQRALRRHAKAASAKRSKGRVNARAADVRRAATHYASVVTARTGAESPFADLLDPTLDAETVDSLKAERDALVERLEASPRAPRLDSTSADLAPEGERSPS